MNPREDLFFHGGGKKETLVDVLVENTTSVVDSFKKLQNPPNHLFLGPFDEYLAEMMALLSQFEMQNDGQVYLDDVYIQGACPAHL